MKIGERIKLLREQLHLQQAELAQRAQVSPSYISMLEKGERHRVSGDILQRLARALGVSLDDLLGEEPVPELAPPVAEMRAVGWSEESIARFLRAWDGWSVATRQNQRQHALAMYAEYEALTAEMDAAHRKAQGEPPLPGDQVRSVPG